MELIETSVFTRKVTDLLGDEEYARFQTELARSPEKGRLIRGGGGLRKIRIAASGRGKRGGARVIYYWAERRHVILLLYIYAKNETADLTPRQIVELGKLVRSEFEDEHRPV